MNKKIILLAAGIIMAATALASSSGSMMGDPVSVPIHGQNEGTPSGRPHAPARILFNAYLEFPMEGVTVTLSEHSFLL